MRQRRRKPGSINEKTIQRFGNFSPEHSLDFNTRFVPLTIQNPARQKLNPGERQLRSGKTLHRK